MSSLSRHRGLRRPLVAGAIAVMAGVTAVAVLFSRPAGPMRDWARAPATVQAVMWPEPRPLAEFELTAQDGSAFRRESLRGQWNFLFFGYTACPDVCPMSLQAMREMRRYLVESEPAAADYRFILVSVDPANDRPEDLAVYLEWFGPAFTGLTGERDELDRLARSLAVKYQVFEDEQGGRSIDHTSSVLVVDPEARMVGALPAPLRPTAMLGQFEALRAYLDD